MEEMSDEGKEKLLENFILNNRELEQLEDEISGLNIFEAIGMQRQEIRHSATLAFLLGPKNPHGLGQHFLKKLLKDIARDSTTEISPIDLDSADFSDVEVQCEWSRKLDGKWRKIDIIIICHSAKLIVAIENKIDASEHEDQLKDYKEIVENERDWKKFKKEFKKMFVFLTVDGSDPEKEDDQENWINYSHQDLIKLLKESYKANKQNLGSDQDVLIRHYIELMRRRILTDSRIAELVRKIDKTHKQAIDLIIEHRPDAVAEVAEQLKQLINNENSLELVFPTKTRIRFYCKSWSFREEWVGEWKHSEQMGLLFEFENRPEKLKLVLMVLNLKNYENRKQLFHGFPKGQNFKEEMKTDFPRVWEDELSLNREIDNESKINKEVEDWWKSFIENNLERISCEVNRVIDEVGARPNDDGNDINARG